MVCAYLNVRETPELRPSNWRIEDLRNEENEFFVVISNKNEAPSNFNYFYFFLEVVNVILVA